MKRKTLLALLLMSIVNTLLALTFTVTVPDGTNACYIAGTFNGWNTGSHAMTKIADNQYQIEIETSTTGLQYKYCSGPGWEYVEKNASGGDISDRTYNANDVVAKWAAVYNPVLIPGDITITANVPADTPDGEVYVVGSFLVPSWDPAEAIKMTKLSNTQYQVVIPNVTVIQYKLLCGKSWENEELEADGSQVQNRTASVSSPNVTITVARWKNTGAVAQDIISHTFSSFAPLQGSRRILIYLPPDYETATEKRYPVLYMHDAQNVLETGPFGTWDVKNTLNAMYAAGKNVGIVVAIDNSAGRMSEYTPFPNASNAPNPKGNEYLQAIIDNVIPYINSNYRTLSDRENTGICGSSLGGLISYYAALKEQNTFGLIAPMSPSFWYCKNDLSNYVDNWSGSYKDKTRMYFICGDNEGSSSMVPDMQQFYNKTIQKGFATENLKYEVVSGAGHNEGSWKAQFGRVYEFLFDIPMTSGVKDIQNSDNDIQISIDKNSIGISNLSNELFSFSLFDVTGKQLTSKISKKSFSINALQKGVYIAKLNIANKEYSQKIIIP